MVCPHFGGLVACYYFQGDGINSSIMPSIFSNCLLIHYYGFRCTSTRCCFLASLLSLIASNQGIPVRSNLGVHPPSTGLISPFSKHSLTALLCTFWKRRVIFFWVIRRLLLHFWSHSSIQVTDHKFFIASKNIVI